MITCPFCNKKVKDKVDQSDVEDDHANNFYCPTYVAGFNNIKRSHYTRYQMKHLINGGKIYQYTALIPPFEIVWYTTGSLRVYQFDLQAMYQEEITNFKDFLKTCQRFKILVPFL